MTGSFLISIQTERFSIRLMSTISCCSSAQCSAQCENQGICVSTNTCQCPIGYNGTTCQIRKSSLFPYEVHNFYLARIIRFFSMNQKDIFLTTFGPGSNQISSSPSSNFSFSTSFAQGFSFPIRDGYVAFINTIDGWSEWHTGSLDHTMIDTNGYLLVVNSNGNVVPSYDRTIDQLCLGERYEWPTYIANILRPINYVKSIIQFEVRSTTDPNVIIAQLNSGALDEFPTLIWTRFSL